jgi:iron complex transport system substrate-binding protein
LRARRAFILLSSGRKSGYRSAMAKIAPALAAVVLAILPGSPAAGDPAKPQRIVSMNQCTDLFVLMLAEPERIASLSFVTKQKQWTPPEYAETVARLRVNHALAEEVLVLKPDLVVTTPFTGSAAVRLLQQLGYRVETFNPELSFADIRTNILKMGDLLGEAERAKVAVAAFDARLAEIRSQARAPGRVAAIFGVNGWMAGKDTLTAEAAHAAGYRTLGETMGYSGFRFVPLEQVIAASPDLLAPSNAWTDPPSIATNAMNHPAMRKLAEKGDMVSIPERLLVCGSPAALDAAALLVSAGR